MVNGMETEVEVSAFTMSTVTFTQRIKCDFLVIYTINRAKFSDVFNVVRISILTNIIITDKRKCIEKQLELL